MESDFKFPILHRDSIEEEFMTLKMTESLPKEYKPSELKKPEIKDREEVIYACGYEERPNKFGMFHGPNPDLKEMLEVVPEEENKNPVIIRFNLDGTDEVIYRWKKKKRLWKRVI